MAFGYERFYALFSIADIVAWWRLCPKGTQTVATFFIFAGL